MRDALVCARDPRMWHDTRVAALALASIDSWKMCPCLSWIKAVATPTHPKYCVVLGSYSIQTFFRVPNTWGGGRRDRWRRIHDASALFAPRPPLRVPFERPPLILVCIFRRPRRAGRAGARHRPPLERRQDGGEQLGLLALLLRPRRLRHGGGRGGAGWGRRKRSADWGL